MNCIYSIGSNAGIQLVVLSFIMIVRKQSSIDEPHLSNTSHKITLLIFFPETMYVVAMWSILDHYHIFPLISSVDFQLSDAVDSK